MNTKYAGTGFTLIELLMIIGIIAVLAGIFVPNFNKAKEKALTKEAIANLRLIAAAEKVYRMEKATYYGPQNDYGEISDNLKLYFINEENWDYNITSADANAFAARAKRQSGYYSNCIFEVTQSTDVQQISGAGTCP